MKYTKWIFPVLFSIFLLTSCSHEETEILDESSSHTEGLLKNYPKEITLDNWGQFVHAPKEVLDYFVAQEAKVITRNEVVEKDGFGTSLTPAVVFGQIQVQTKGVDPNTAWLGNTGIYTYNFSDLTDSLGNTLSLNFDYGNNSNYFFNRNGFTDVMCFYYENVTNGEFTNTQWRNGVSTLDIVFISRHLIGLECFTEVWQYLAADVDGDGDITTFDMTELQKLILYITTEMPVLQGNSYNQPVIYFPQNDYTLLQNYLNIVGCAGFDTSLMSPFYDDVSCQRISDEEFDRYAIKRGDVSGNWSF